MRREPITSPHIDPNYINRLSVDDLRDELTLALHKQALLMDALRELPAVPDSCLLMHLSEAASWSADNDVGRLLQRKHGTEAVFPKSECEGGAGIWWRIRQGMLQARPQSLSELEEREALATQES